MIRVTSKELPTLAMPFVKNNHTKQFSPFRNRIM